MPYNGNWASFFFNNRFCPSWPECLDNVFAYVSMDDLVGWPDYQDCANKQDWLDAGWVLPPVIDDACDPIICGPGQYLDNESCTCIGFEETGEYVGSVFRFKEAQGNNLSLTCMNYVSCGGAATSWFEENPTSQQDARECCAMAYGKTAQYYIANANPECNSSGGVHEAYDCMAVGPGSKPFKPKPQKPPGIVPDPRPPIVGGPSGPQIQILPGCNRMMRMNNGGEWGGIPYDSEQWTQWSSPNSSNFYQCDDMFPHLSSQGAYQIFADPNFTTHPWLGYCMKTTLPGGDCGGLQPLLSEFGHPLYSGSSVMVTPHYNTNIKAECNNGTYRYMTLRHNIPGHNTNYGATSYPDGWLLTGDEACKQKGTGGGPDYYWKDPGIR